ncbi:hypothetical protein OCU04_002243 [Sclerotinia nivalis]|uniref:Uncharacterized protein n=1 Tax=Sclerotinia nivalis TaxID=352851 RepID=A0A9X0AZQ8_9HELO|nr:hypothetical protein OCU04_002243 [Sclerotinia nivalis]
MAEVPEPGGDNPAGSKSGSLTLGSGKTGDLSGKTLVGQDSPNDVDLSGTIQDPDAPPPNTRRAVPGTSIGGLGGIGLPRTPGGDIDLSGIGRPPPRDTRPADPRPEQNAPQPNPQPQQVDISQFKNPDGSTDWARVAVVLSTKVQRGLQEARSRRRLQRPRRPRAEEPGPQPQGKSEDSQPPDRGKQAGRRFGGLRTRRNPSQAFLSKRGIPVTVLSDITEKTTPLASPEDKGKTGLPSPGGGGDEKSIKGKKSSGSHATNPGESEGEDDLDGASPVGTKPKPLPPSDNISPSKSEKFRRLTREPAKSLTIEQKFRQWIEHSQSSEKRTGAEENEGRVGKELMNARERHIAWIEDGKRAANDLIKNETDGNAVIALNKTIERLDRHLKEAWELEDKRANRNILKDHLELETSPTIKHKFEDQLRELNLQIENEEGKERIRLKRHMSGDSALISQLRKVADMTPAERAAFNIRSGQPFTAAASRPPGQLEQSSAERALRDKWIREDSPHENVVMKIESMSDSKEKTDAWKALQKVRRSLLLERQKELQQLWRKQADEMKADREFAWSEEEDGAEGEDVPGIKHLSQGKMGGIGRGSGGKDVAQAELDKARAQLAKDLERKKAEEAENAKKIEEAKKLEALKGTSGALTGRDSLPSYRGQGKPNPLGIELPKFPEVPGLRGGSGLSGRGGLRLRRPGQLDISGLGQMPEIKGFAGAETIEDGNTTKIKLPANPENKTPSPKALPYTAKTPLSPIHERRSEPVGYDTHPGVARFLENMAAERIRKEMLEKGIEPVDLDAMRKEVDEFTRPPRTDAGTLARNAAAELRRQERIKAAKERLEKAAKAEEERLKIKRAKEAKDIEEGIESRRPFSWEDPDSLAAAEEMEQRKKNDKNGEKLLKEMEEKKRLEKEIQERNAALKKAEEDAERLFKALEEQKRAEDEIRKKYFEDELKRKKEEKAAKEKKDREDAAKMWERIKNGAAIDLDAIVNKIAETARRAGTHPRLPVGDALKDQEKEVQDYIKKLKNELEQIGLGEKSEEGSTFEQQERERIERERRIQEEFEVRERERERQRILAAQREKEERESRPRAESELRQIMEGEREELQKAADREQLVDDEYEFDDELSFFQTISLGVHVPGLSWLGRTDPEFAESDSQSESSHHSLFDLTDEDSEYPDLSTSPPGPADPRLPPDAPASTHGKSPEESKIHLHLTIFTSPVQYLPDAPPLHYVCYKDIPLSWKISQLKDFLRAPKEVKADSGTLIEDFPGCVGFKKEDGEVIAEGSPEVKNMRLRMGKRWLNRESRTLMEEGFRDWENLIVLMVGEGENVEEGHWRDCVWEADGVAGWKEGWPGVGMARAPKDRRGWVGMEWDDFFLERY